MKTSCFIFIAYIISIGSVYGTINSSEFTSIAPYGYPERVLVLSNKNVVFTSLKSGSTNYSLSFLNPTGELIKEHRFEAGHAGPIFYDSALQSVFFFYNLSQQKNSALFAFNEAGKLIRQIPFPSRRNYSNVQYMGNGSIFMQSHERELNQVVPYLLKSNGEFIAGKPVPCFTSGGTSGQNGRIGPNTTLVNVKCGSKRNIRYYNVNQMDAPFLVDFSGYSHCGMRGEVHGNLNLAKCVNSERVDIWLFNRKGQRVRKIFTYADPRERVHARPSFDKKRILVTISSKGKIRMLDLYGNEQFQRKIKGEIADIGFFADGSFYVGQILGYYKKKLLTFFADGTLRGSTILYDNNGKNTPNGATEESVRSCQETNPNFYFNSRHSHGGVHLKVWNADAKLIYFRQWPKEHGARFYCIPDNEYIYISLKTDGPFGQIIKEKL